MKICLFVVEEKINPPLIWRFLDHLTCKIPFKIIRFRTTNIYLNTIGSDASLTLRCQAMRHSADHKVITAPAS